jgi:hypothetical protein
MITVLRRVLLAASALFLAAPGFFTCYPAEVLVGREQTVVLAPGKYPVKHRQGLSCSIDIGDLHLGKFRDESWCNPAARICFYEDGVALK